MSVNSNTYSLAEGNEQTLNDIKQLQTQEMDIYNSLDDGELTTEQKQQGIDKMNQISQMRINLYGNLKNMYTSYNQNVSTSRNTLDEQLVAINIVENELEEAKKRLAILEINKSNKLRSVEINTYYSKQYDAYATFMKTLVYLCIPILILTFLGNKGLIPSSINGFLIGIIIVIAILVLGYQIIDLMRRDNMNFDEYNWYFDKSSAPADATSAANPVNPWEPASSTASSTCIGEACCYAGSTYEASSNMCIPNTTSTATTTTADTTSTATTSTADTTTTETFVSNILSKYARKFHKPVAYL
jgi:hypothetical protein